MHVRIDGDDGRGRAAAHLRAAALLRGVPARPRVHRGARHHGAHLRHLPGRLPDERGAGDGGRLRRSRSTTARSATCGGCSTAASGSRATRCTCTCCTRRTSSATRAAIAMAADHREVVERGLLIKKAGNALMAAVGGREIHPINVRVGGFYRAPTRAELRPAAELLERAREAALETVRWTGTLPFPDFEHDHELVALRVDGEYPIDRGRIVSSAGLDIAPGEFDDVVRRGAGRALERAARPHPRRAALPRRPAGALQPQLRRAVAGGARGGAARPASGPTCRNPFQSIVVRASRCCTPATRRCGSSPPTSRRTRRRSRSCRARASGFGRQRGAARHALAPLRDRRRRDDPRRADRPADLAEPARDRAGPARVRRSATSRLPTTSCATAASRRSATTTPASPARRTS